MTRPSADYVYICGSGHSGSTLLEMFLAGHPEMAAVGELHNLSFQIAHGRVCSCGALPRECSHWQAVAAVIRQYRWIDIFTRPHEFLISRERPRNAVERGRREWNRALSYVTCLHPILKSTGLQHLMVQRGEMEANRVLLTDAIRTLTGAAVLVDSSKDYVRMREIYDRAERGRVKVVYLFRDGRGCLWSSLKRGGVSARTAATQWAKNQRRTRAMLRGVRVGDRLDVRYEDLCGQPEHVLRGVCSLVGVAYHPAMLDLAPTEHHTIAGNRIRVDRRLAVRVDDAWRERLTAAQLAEFERVAGRENRKLGYPRSIVSAAPAEPPGDGRSLVLEAPQRTS